MNQKEAGELAEVLRQLTHGPGRGWIELFQPEDRERLPEERLHDLELWLGTWITPPVARVVGRYRKSPKAGRRR